MNRIMNQLETIFIENSNALENGKYPAMPLNQFLQLTKDSGFTVGFSSERTIAFKLEDNEEEIFLSREATMFIEEAEEKGVVRLGKFGLFIGMPNAYNELYKKEVDSNRLRVQHLKEQSSLVKQKPQILNLQQKVNGIAKEIEILIKRIEE